jgi:imidazolonepropionase-like amidohydrolase
MQVIAIRAGHLFDSRTGQLRDKQVIVLEGDRIREVSAEEKITIPGRMEVVDLSQATVLPGLVDGHTHVFDSLSAGDRLNTSIEKWTLTALKEAQADLRAGFTTIRDVGTHGEGYGDLAVRDVIERGLFDGPRMQVSTKGITAGSTYLGAPGLGVPTGIPNIRGVDDARAVVREQIHYGADWIKIFATSGYSFSSNGQLFVAPLLTKEEVQAIVDESHRHHRRVACHAFGGEGLRDCIDAGADTIEHGQGLDDGTITKMLGKHIYYVPTLYRYSMPEVVERDRIATGGRYSLTKLHDQAFRLALSRGVRIAFGSGVDGHPFAHARRRLSSRRSFNTGWPRRRPFNLLLTWRRK